MDAMRGWVVLGGLTFRLPATVGIACCMSFH
jgi:hypothetical protein